MAPLLDHAQTISALQVHFLSAVPSHFGKACQVLGLSQGTLSVAVTNSTIAAKLRQQAPDIVILLQNRGCEVNGIRVKVQVSYDRPTFKPQKPELSLAAQKTLHEFSLSLSDSPLKQALNKIVKKKY